MRCRKTAGRQVRLQAESGFTDVCRGYCCRFGIHVYFTDSAQKQEAGYPDDPSPQTKS